MEDYRVNPFNRIPPFVLLLTLAIVAIELVFTAANHGLVGGAAGTGWRLTVMDQWAFKAPVWNEMLTTGHFTSDGLLRFVTYPFLHLGLGHMLLGALMTLALGKGVNDMISPWAVPVLFFGTSIVGALVYAVFVSSNAVLFGAHTGDFGMVGAITYVRWLDLKSANQNQVLAFRLIFVIMIWQVVWGITSYFTGRGIALDWIALIAAFLSGFLIAFAFEPGGWSRLLARLRER